MSLLFKGRRGNQLSRNKLPLLRAIQMFFINHLRQSVSSLGELFNQRLASFMTIAVLSLSLTLPASFFILVKNTEQLTSQWDTASEITLYLQQGATKVDMQQLVNRLRLWPEVEDVTFIAASDALENFKQSSGLGDVLNYLDSNPLPNLITIVPQQKHTTATGTRALVDKLEQEREVDHVQIDIEWLNRLKSLLAVIDKITLSIALVLSSAVILIVGNTIRLDILSKRSEIIIMKLVGATDSFIQRPFLYCGFWFGLLGGVLASLAVSLLLWQIQTSIDEFSVMYQQNFVISGIQLLEFFVIVLASVLLGLTGSYLAVNKHIKEIEPR